MRQPRILAVVSAVDLDHRYGCTPAWWQLWKGLYEADVDLIVTPYRGRAVESPWWRVEENPCYWEGESFDLARRAVARFRGDTLLRREEASPEDSVVGQASSARRSAAGSRRAGSATWSGSSSASATSTRSSSSPSRRAT